MTLNAQGRALQHLLVQGFTLYTCPAAVCTRLGAPLIMETHPWAVYFESGAVEWCAQLKDDDPLRARMAEAASQATKKDPWALCHFEGVYLALPLAVDEVRHARARLEVAKNLSVEPPSIEGVMAIPDDILELELKRRRKVEKAQGSGKKDGQAI